MAMHSHIERILWTEDQISRRVSELAAEVSADFAGGSLTPIVVGVATGAFLFLADIVRKIEFSVPVDFIRAESYGSGTESNGAPTISLDLKVDINGRHVILVFPSFPPVNTQCHYFALAKLLLIVYFLFLRTPNYSAMLYFYIRHGCTSFNGGK